MQPAELEAFPRKPRCIAGVESLVEVGRPAVDAELPAHVAARARAGSWVQHRFRSEELDEVADEFSAAVARIVRVTIPAVIVEMVEAGQVRHGACGLGAAGSLAKTGLSG